MAAEQFTQQLSLIKSSNIDSQESITAVSIIAQLINDGSLTILKVVESMGDILVNSDPFIRAKGVTALGSLIESVTIDKAVGSVLLNFFLEKLSDVPSVQPSLKSILALLSKRNLPNSDIQLIPIKLLKELDVSSFPQSTRNTTLQIMNEILQTPITKQDEFVYSFIQVMDNEKDPRNLLLAFKIVESIGIKGLDLGNYAEDLFDVFFCYFPITFRAPKGDDSGITAKDLKMALKKCIASNSLFAEYSIPPLVEKLSSTAPNAKIDAMEALIESLPIYSASCITSIYTSLWKNLKESIFHSSNEECFAVALDCLEAIAISLSKSTSMKSDSVFEKFMTLILDECLNNIKMGSMEKNSGMVIKSISCACKCGFDFVVDFGLMDKVFELYDLGVLVTGRKVLVDVMVDLISGCRTFYALAEVAMDVDEIKYPLSKHKEHLLNLLTTITTTTDQYVPIQKSAIKGILELLSTTKFLTSSETKLCLQILLSIILKSDKSKTTKIMSSSVIEYEDEEYEELRKYALECLCDYSKFGNLVEMGILDALFDCLPTKINDTSISYNYALDALRELSSRKEIFLVCLPVLLGRFNEIPNTPSPSTQKYIKKIQSTIHKTLRKNQSTPSLNQTIIKTILDKSTSETYNLEIIKVLGMIIGLVIRYIKDDHERDSFIALLFKMFWDGSFNDDSELSILLVNGVLNCPRTQKYPVTSIPDFLSSLIGKISNCQNEVVIDSIGKIVGCLLNKWSGEDSDLEVFLNGKVEEMFSTKINNDNVKTEERLHFLTVYIWVIKGLVLRSHKSYESMILKLIALLSITKERKILELISNSFDMIISSSDDDVLTKESYARINFLYKQKFFYYSKDLLLNGYNAAADDVKQYYLIAFSNVYRNIPTSVLLNELPSLLPILIQSLKFPEPSLKQTSLKTLKFMLLNTPDFFTSHISTLLPLLLSCTLPTDGNSIFIRQLSLDILGKVCDVVEFKHLFGFKSLVLRHLKGVLDDAKRVVRKDAGRVRNKWFLLTGAKE